MTTTLYEPNDADEQDDHDEANEIVFGKDDGRRVWDCVHGHGNCALTEGGSCCDETWQHVRDTLRARRERSHCCTCPHENYLTTSVSRHEHSCASCGQTFTDAQRPKRYFGRGPA